jgi:type 1 fimbria pilin
MTVGVKKYDLNNYFSVIPNPSNGMIQISGNTIANSQVHVLDITGKLLLIKDTHAANSMQLDLSDLPNGVYFIRVESASGSSVQKVILAK